MSCRWLWRRLLKGGGVIKAVAGSLRLPLASIRVVGLTLGRVVEHVVGGGSVGAVELGVVVIAIGRVLVFIPGHFEAGDESEESFLDTVDQLKL